METRSKLAVILHADVVGSTALVQKDERVAHDRIRDAFLHFSDVITRHGGTAHEVRGDALVAEFSKASDAVSAAAAFQAAHAEYLHSVADEIRPEVRVGIAMGEVVVADGTLTGPGVVLAQRVEQLAPPDGICISGAVHEAIPDRLPFAYDDLGAQQLKGFDAPVHVRGVTLRAGETVPPPDAIPGRAGKNGKRPPLASLAGIAVVILAATGLLLWLQPWNASAPPPAPAAVTSPKPAADKPAIAVLPFDNLSREAEDEKFSDGIAENIITTLGRIPQLLVIARNASFQYKGEAQAPTDVANALGVRYLLQGSLQRAGDRIRVTATLVDAPTGEQLWSRSFDRELEDFFAVQDEITLGIVTGLQLELVEGETSLLSRRQTNSIEAWAKFTEARRLFYEYTPESNRQARRLAEQAIALDPDYAFAYAGIAWTHLYDVERSWSTDAARSLELAKRNATRALELDPEIGAAFMLRARVALLEGRFTDAQTQARLGVEAEPNSVAVRSVLASIEMATGNYRAAIDQAHTSKRLFPNQPQTLAARTSTKEILAYHQLGEYAEAIRLADAVLAGVADEGTHLIVRLLGIASRVAERDLENARADARRLLVERPEFTLATLIFPDLDQLQDKAAKPAFLALLEKAGLPADTP